MPEPFKIVAYEVGAANVLLRDNGQRLGYVLSDFYGRWTAYNKGEKVAGPFLRRDEAAGALFMEWLQDA